MIYHIKKEYEKTNLHKLIANNMITRETYKNLLHAEVDQRSVFYIDKYNSVAYQLKKGIIIRIITPKEVTNGS